MSGRLGLVIRTEGDGRVSIRTENLILNTLMTLLYQAITVHPKFVFDKRKTLFPSTRYSPYKTMASPPDD